VLEELDLAGNLPKERESLLGDFLSSPDASARLGEIELAQVWEPLAHRTLASARASARGTDGSSV
jgi:hypothetical protein